MRPTVTGVDGCKGGWVAVTLSPEDVTVTVAGALADLNLRGACGIDMPLGLLAAGWRTADALARHALGRRGATVFAIPPRSVWERGTYAEANTTCRRLTGRGLSVQAWGLRARLLEADRFRASRPATECPAAEDCPAAQCPAAEDCPATLYEVHPELSFSALAGAPVPASKHSAEGLAVRRRLLTAAGITLPAGRIAGAGDDDVLDAAAVAWSARRILRGTAVSLTDPEQRADDNSEIAIRY